MRVLSVDPGGTTGFMTWERTPGGESIQAWEVRGQEEALETVKLELAKGLDAIVIEKYVIVGARDSNANLTIEIIGTCRWMARAAGVRFVEQTPGQARNFSTDDKLKRLNWWGTDHARSAIRHMVFFLSKEGLIDRRILLG